MRAVKIVGNLIVTAKNGISSVELARTLVRRALSEVFGLEGQGAGE